MTLREGCDLCFADGIPTPHAGDHVIQPVYGGRASCPIDEISDRDLIEELAWVSLEEALVDAGWPLPEQTDLLNDVHDCIAFMASFSPAGLGLWHGEHRFAWQLRTDEHLEGDSSTADVVCTITAPRTTIPA